jgi:hypothetical protein
MNIGTRQGQPGSQEVNMDTKQLAEWVEARICLPCKQGYTCDDWECEQARKIADILKRMVPFRGKNSEGKDVSGWFVPE